MWVSTSILGSRVVMVPQSLGSTSIPRKSEGGLMIVCSSRPKKKATSHHMKTRPRKTQPWDINRKPTVYDPLPPLPPDWSVVIPADDSSVAVTSQPPTPST